MDELRCSRVGPNLLHFLPVDLIQGADASHELRFVSMVAHAFVGIRIALPLMVDASAHFAGHGDRLRCPLGVQKRTRCQPHIPVHHLPAAGLGNRVPLAALLLPAHRSIVPAGISARWRRRSGIDHDVRSNDGANDSGMSTQVYQKGFIWQWSGLISWGRALRSQSAAPAQVLP